VPFLIAIPARYGFERTAGSPMLSAAACLAVLLFTAFTAFAQASNKQEESARETKQEIERILSDIEKRSPPPVVQPPAMVVQAPAVPAGPVESRIAWQRWVAFSLVLAVFGVLELIIFKSSRMSRVFKLVIGGMLLVTVVGVLSSDPSRHSSEPPSSAGTLAPLGFRFSVGDTLVNVNNGVEVGVVLRTETAHTFRNGTVGRAYIVARPNGVEMDMVADALERIAAKR